MNKKQNSIDYYLQENIKEESLNILRKLQSLSIGLNVYVVGGFVRDMFLQHINNIHDIDLIINNNVYEYSKKIANFFNAKLIILDDTKHIYRVILKHTLQIKHVDIAMMNGNNIQEDLLNRDFTINALAFKLNTFVNFKLNIIVSQHDSQKTFNDLQLKILDTISNKVFVSDPLRMLRVFRFMSKYQYIPTKNTLRQIKEHAQLISTISPERIKNEFCQILSSNTAYKLIKHMYKCKLLTAVLPEIKNLEKANKQHYYHPGGLLQHSFETMKSVENILNNLEIFFPKTYIHLQKHFNNNIMLSEYVTRSNLLKFVSLLHDNAKPETVSYKNNKMHFLGHDVQGALKIKKIMKLMKFSKKDIDISTLLIANHMRPSNLTKNKVITIRAALKLFRDIKEDIPDLLILSMADWYSYIKLKCFSMKTLKMQKQNVQKLLFDYYQYKYQISLPKIIDGNIIMKQFNLKSGPHIGELLEFVNEAISKGKISNTKEALEILSSQI
ncbi:MAG: HD domain-containing protein [Endomicrobium sp.]|jgi:poly(A) polymerase|nr:HD domain-containing protein [Endomicrobium sp.]